MKLLHFLTAAVVATSVPAIAQEDPEPVRLTCDVGPLYRFFGGNSWIVYSCSDQASMIVMAPPETAAGNSYLVLKADVAGYEIFAESDGDREITEAARKELSEMTMGELAGLLADTRAANTSNHP